MKTKEHCYFVSGMHCASCELLIERRLLEIKGVKSVEASTSKGEVLVEYEDKMPCIEKLNHFFKKENYHFSETPTQEKGFLTEENLQPIGIAALVIMGFLILSLSGFSSLIRVDTNSALPMFFFFGVLAGLSTCVALVGGLVLSLSKTWSGGYQPHLLFNAGRLITFAFLGGILGLVGEKLRLSPLVTPFLVLAVSAWMVFLGLQMLGFRRLARFQFSTPKFFTRYIVRENNFQGQLMPAILGGLTFFLPCGFTLTAQGIALLSGNPLRGALIMLMFALGTLPTLLAIGLSSAKYIADPKSSQRFLKIAGALIIFFAVYNVNSQLNVLGVNNLTDLAQAGRIKTENVAGLAVLVNGKQLLKMNASASGYTPNYFKVKAGVPVRWEITDTGTSGCTNAVISRSLFEGQIDLAPGQTSVKEFTPTSAGKYKFSCWMGMISGVIEVVGQK